MVWRVTGSRMPGDGIGNDLMEASRPLLDALDLDAEYVEADVGWTYWCTEGEALPAGPLTS